MRRDSSGNVARDGDVYGVPRRWRPTVVAMRSDISRERGLKRISDWADLL